MSKRRLNLDWKVLDGAAVRKRILHLTADEDQNFFCPVSTCLHDGYKSSRGVRKHINSQHPWYYWFDEQPRIQRQEAVRLPKKRIKPSTHHMPAFTMETGLGKDFLDWLMTPLGGGKPLREATQIGRRAMKFLHFALGEGTDVVLQQDYVDCVIGSPTIIINFMQSVVEDWNLASSGALNYLKAVSDLMDFRKANGVTDNVLRTFATSEVYIRRGLGNLTRQKKIDYARNLDLESLISRNSWANLEELQDVIPYHTPKFESIVKRIRNEETPTINDLAFSTRFIITFLFLRVKSSRPMTYRFLTLDQLDKAKKNGGYVDQSTFKTASTYAFDTLILTDNVLAIIDTYVKVIRPLLHPASNYVILTTNGTQYTGMGTAMSLLVFEAIGKMINPSRYRQIMESESAEKLSISEREAISKDNKHSSEVAKRIYQKKLSRDVAQEGLACVKKLVGPSRDEHNDVMARSLAISDDEVKDPADDELILSSISKLNDPLSTMDEAMEPSQPSNNVEDLPSAAAVAIEPNGPETRQSTVADHIVCNTDAVLDDHIPKKCSIETSSNASVTISLCSTSSTSSLQTLATPLVSSTASNSPVNEVKVIPIFQDIDVEVKKEEAQRQVEETPRLLRFTSDEDMYLRQGTKKYGLGRWSKILKDTDFKFHDGRTRDSLRVRADTLGITKKNRKSRRQSKTGEKPVEV